MKIIKRYSSSIILIISSLMGCLIGFIFKDKAVVLKPFGDIFLNLMYTIVVPLVFFTISSSIANMTNLKKLGKILRYTFLIFVITSSIAAIMMLIVLKFINPVNDIISLEFTNIEKVSIAKQIVSSLTVSNFINLFDRSNMLPLIIFSTLFGIATSTIKSPSISKNLEDISKIILGIVKIIMYYAPIGICCYFASMIAEYGSSLLGSYLKATIIYYIVSILYFLIFYTIYAYISDRKNGIKRFYKNIIPSLATSLSTQSSLASLPTNLTTADNINITPSVSKVALPLGSTMHMEGSSMGAILKIVFLFAIFNKPFTGIDIYLISILIAVLSAVVMSGIPGGGLIGEMLIVSLYGLSNEAFVVIATIGFLIDPPATMLNVCGDISSSMLIDKCINKKEQVT